MRLHDGFTAAMRIIRSKNKYFYLDGQRIQSAKYVNSWRQLLKQSCISVKKMFKMFFDMLKVLFISLLIAIGILTFWRVLVGFFPRAKESFIERGISLAMLIVSIPIVMLVYIPPKTRKNKPQNALSDDPLLPPWAYNLSVAITILLFCLALTAILFPIVALLVSA